MSYFSVVVCNFFERTYKEYDTRISDSRRSMSVLNDTLEGEEVRLRLPHCSFALDLDLDLDHAGLHVSML
jgi:hypothetical protein